MKKMAFTSGLLGVVLGGLLVPSQVLADNLGNTVTVADANADGVVSFNGSLGGTTVWTVNVTTGISKPTLGSATFANMDLNSVNVSSTGGGTITLELTDTDFTALAGNTSYHMDAGGTTNGTLSVNWFVDDGNTAFATTTNIGSLGPFAGGAFSGDVDGGALLNGSYSITAVATITHTAAGQVSTGDRVAFRHGLSGIRPLELEAEESLSHPKLSSAMHSGRPCSNPWGKAFLLFILPLISTKQRALGCGNVLNCSVI